MSTQRCFVAIPLPACMREPLAEAVAALRHEDRHWDAQRWVDEAQWHVTLQFLGDVDEADIGRLIESLGAAVAGVTPFPLAVDGLRPSPGSRPRMIWAALTDVEGGCETLHARVERASLSIGVVPDERTFHPHVTLCRARDPRRVRGEALDAANALVRTSPPKMSVSSVTLFASRLTPHGPIHSELASWSLHEA